MQVATEQALSTLICARVRRPIVSGQMVTSWKSRDPETWNPFTETLGF